MNSYYIINIFIIAFIYFAWFWSSPKLSIWKRSFKYVHKIIIWLGLHHGWSMFSPPVKSTEYLEADIFIKNKEIKKWNAVRIDKLSWFKAFLDMRHRKYQRALFSNNSNEIKSALANYLFEKNNSNTNKPYKIDIYIDYTELPPAHTPNQTSPLKKKMLVYRWMKKINS